MAQWSVHEDEQLRKLVKEYGPKRWSVIAAKLKTKGSKQCRRRWKNHLNADLKSGGWTAEEDRILLEGHRLYGNKWTEIAKMVGGRTDNAVKNRYAALCKRDMRGGTRGGAARGGRGGGRKARLSDSDEGASDVDVEEDSDDADDAKRASSSSVSREASPVRCTRRQAAGHGTDRTPARKTPPAASPPPITTAAAPAVGASEPAGSSGVRRLVGARRRHPAAGSTPLELDSEERIATKRRALLAVNLAPDPVACNNVAGADHQQQQQSPRTPCLAEELQQPSFVGLVPPLARNDGDGLGSGEGFTPSPPQSVFRAQEYSNDGLVRGGSQDVRFGRADADGMVSSGVQPKKLPLTINIPNAASAEPPGQPPSTAAAPACGIEIRVIKDLLTPLELQYARELNDMQLPLHINVDEDAGIISRPSAAVLSAVNDAPLTTSRHAAQNALTALFSPVNSGGTDFNDVLKWFQTGLTPRSNCGGVGDDGTPRLMSRLGLTPCGLASRGCRDGDDDGSGLLGTGLTPKCLLDSISPGGRGGLGSLISPPLLDVLGGTQSKRTRRQIAVAAAVAAAASTGATPSQHPTMESNCQQGPAADEAGPGPGSAAALGLLSPVGMELHAGHRQLLTKLIQTAACTDGGNLGGPGNGGAGDAGPSTRPCGIEQRMTPPSPPQSLLHADPFVMSSHDVLPRFQSSTPMLRTPDGCDGVPSTSQQHGGSSASCGGVILMPHFTQQELLLLLEVLNSGDLQALPPPPTVSEQHQQH